MLESDIGRRLKQKRQEVGISLRELARRTELTASFLSQVEHKKTNVSLDSLRRIAEALQVPLFYFLSEAGEENYHMTRKPRQTDEDSDQQGYLPIVRAGLRPRLLLPESGVVYEKLIPDIGRKMEAMIGRLAPGTDNIARRLREPTEELIYVLNGALLVALDYGEFILQKGDSIYFEGASLQKLVCASDEEVCWISAITPAVF